MWYIVIYIVLHINSSCYFLRVSYTTGKHVDEIYLTRSITLKTRNNCSIFCLTTLTLRLLVRYSSSLTSLALRLKITWFPKKVFIYSPLEMLEIEFRQWRHLLPETCIGFVLYNSEGKIKLTMRVYNCCFLTAVVKKKL